MFVAVFTKGYSGQIESQKNEGGNFEEEYSRKETRR